MFWNELNFDWFRLELNPGDLGMLSVMQLERADLLMVYLVQQAYFAEEMNPFRYSIP